MKKTLGISFILAHAFCMGVINVLVAYMCSEVSVMQVIGFQFCVPFVVLLPWLLRKGRKSLKTQSMPVHVHRILMVIAAMFFYYTSMHFLPFLNVVLVENSTPVLIPFISLLWLRERISLPLGVAVFIGFLGVYLTLGSHTLVFSLYALFPLYSALVSAYSSVSVKYLSFWGDTKEAILFYYFGIGALVTCPFLFTHIHLCSWVDIVTFSSIGLLTAAAQLALFYAYRYGMPGHLAPFAYSEIVFTAMLSWGLFKDAPGMEAMLGLVCIVASGMIMIFWKERVRD